MSTSNSDTISILNKLIEVCKDGQEGFRLAAEAIKDDESLKSFLFSCSLQRSKFAGELQNEAIKHGEHSPTETSTVVATLHRGWINLKSMLTHGDLAVLQECERGEDTAVSEYRKALSTEPSADIAEIINRQFQEVLATHNSVREMRNSLERQQPPARSAGEYMGDMGHSLQTQTGDVLRNTEEYVRENPFPAILTALGVGFALGLLVRLLESPRRDRIEVPIPKVVQNARDYDYGAAVLPFVWPVVKFFSSNYLAAQKTAKKAYKDVSKEVSKVDVSKYVDPVVKSAKKYL